MAKLEVALLIGAESKAWLADVTALVERLEKATAGKTTKLKGMTTEEEFEESKDDEFSEEKTVVRANGFDDEEESSDDDEEDFTKSATKSKKAKKLTLDDVNAACKERAASEGGGKAGREVVLGILKKKFKTTSITDLKPDSYALVISTMGS